MDEDKFKDKHGKIKNTTESEEIKCKTTDNLNQQNSTASTSTNLKPKSKKSSNLLSAFRRNKKKNKKSETLLESTNVSSLNLESIASNSTLELTEEEESIEPVEPGDGKHVLFKDFDENIHATDSNHSIQSSAKSKNYFLRKLLKKQSSENVKKKSEQDLTNDISKVHDSKNSCKICHSISNKDLTKSDHFESCNSAPTSFINFGKSTLNVTLANGLQSVQELSNQFRDSENHIVQILGKYIKDPTFQRELLETLSQHSKLQLEAERRTSALANDMWMHQIEIGRAQERTLQETLNSLVKQNRQLQIDNEIMFRKHERLVRKLRSFPEMSLKYKCMDCTPQIEYITKHNEDLQDKLDTYVRQIRNLENELHIMEKQNCGLEQELRNSISKINNLKNTVQKSQTDHELEVATLNYELQENGQHFKESMKTGDALLEDLKGLKRQFKSLPIPMSWSNIKDHGSCLTDLLNISRSCIKELSKELLALHAQISLKERDIQTLQETNSRLQENLKKSTTELDNLSKKMDECNIHEANKIITEQKCKILESDLMTAEGKIENLKMKLEMEKSALLTSFPEYDNLSKQISERDKTIEQMKMFINNITSENIALRSQVDALSRSLAESGAGDVVKELAHCQEQLGYFQSQYYNILNEKQVYLNEVEKLKDDKREIIQRLETNFIQLQKQLQDLEKSNKENSSLKQQYESEHQTVLSLQSERMKYLEEKNMLKNIFQHMKAEISRVQTLESAVADISKEASKLAIIAEYNKQIGEKLKTEVHEKDQTILQLRSSVEKLNDIQIQNTKEKLSLCYELSEVCQMKEQLNNILSMEVQKNIALDDTKKEIFQSASTQLKKYEELHKTERSALRELVRDYKILLNQRDNFIKENENLMKELSEVKNAYKDQLNKCESIISAKNENETKIAELIAKERDNISVVNSLHEKLSVEVNRYDSNTKQLEKLIRQLRTEKEDMDSTIKYLQNNIQKLHHDLNESRKNEKEAKDELNKTILERDDLQKKIMELSVEKEKHSGEVNYLNGLCEKVLSDFEASIKSSVEKEEMYKKEIKDQKCVVLNNSKEIENLTETLLSKQSEIEKLVTEIEEYKEREARFNEVVKSFENQTQELSDIECKKQRLENEINNLRIEHDSSKRLLDDVKQEIEYMQKELNDAIEQKEEDYVNYKTHLIDLTRKHEETMEAAKKEIFDLKANLTDITQKLENERSAYATLSEIQKDISSKFLKSIKSFTDEKIARQETESKLKETLHLLNNTKTEKEDLQHQINILLDGLNDEKNRINTLTQERNSAHELLDDWQRKYNEILTKCLSLEHQLRGFELGVTNDSSDNVDTNIREHVELLQKESKETHGVVLALRENITKLQQQITALEFQKSEMTLRLHEMQRKFETEQSLCEQFKNTQKLILAGILKLKEDGRVESNDCNYLLHMVKSSDGV